VTTDLDTLLTALYVKIDDEIGGVRCLGRPPRLSQSELVCLAVAQALLGYHSEARWLRYARKHLRAMFPYLPQRPGYNKRLRAAFPLVKRMIRELAQDSDFWFDNHWIVDSTPVPCAMSRPTVQRSELAGWAGYGYRASHSRFFWGLRLYLVCTPTGMPIMWALADPKIGEREVLAAMLELDAGLVAERGGVLLISDRGFASGSFEKSLAERGERRSRYVVALVHDHQAVPADQVRNVVPAGEGLQGDDVHDTPGFGPAPAELPSLDAEQVQDAGAPLVGQCLAVDQDQRGGGLPGDERARQHRLTGPGRGDEDAQVVPRNGLHSRVLVRSKLGVEGEVTRLAGGPLVNHPETASCLGDELVQRRQQATGKDQIRRRCRS
jgi:hypothetical protein